MDIGTKIKDKRVLLCLTQEELANRCDLTKGYISQLENNKVSVSFETLEMILDVLGIPLSEFFKEDKPSQIIFDNKSKITKEFDGYKQTWLVETAQIHKMEPIMVELYPGCETFHDFPHEGEEFGYVLKGEVLVILDDKQYLCKKDESFYFASSKTHYLKNNSKDKAIIIWVSCPPNF